jgi:hypothetical protein
MGAQLPLLNGNDTSLAGEARVSLSIRESRRARHLILQVLPPRTVEVVVPKGMRPDSVRSFVRDHRDWIHRAGRELLESYPEPDFRPAAIHLPAIDQAIRVSYYDPGTTNSRYRFASGELSLFCPQDDSIQAARLLRRWLLKVGSTHLKPWLMRVAEKTGLKPGNIQIRLQKTRWGSCSSNGNISLNAALLLVEPELVRYLFIHELCHLRYMSHGKRYWQTVARYEPDFRVLDRRLSDCWKHMPTWLPRGGAGEC